MNSHPLPGTSARATPPPDPEPHRFAAACADFLRSLGHAAQLVSLYGPEHLIAAAALRECWLTAQTLLRSEARETLTFALVDGLWVAEGLPVLEQSQNQEALSKLLRRHAIHSLSLASGVKMYELAAFCTLASIAPAAEEWENAAEYLNLKGVRRLTVNGAVFIPANAPWTPPETAPPAASPAPRRSFAALLRDLVEESVQDDDERAHVYEEALGMVKEALERRIAEETSRLTLEKQRVIREQLRTEQVLAATAEGKVVVDQDGRVLNMNPAAEEISGSHLTDLAGKPLAEHLKRGEHLVVLADGRGQDDAAALPGVRVEADEDIRRAIGRSIAIVQDRHGRVIGTCAALPDAVKFKELQKFEEDLLSRVTHELKAPLTALSAALEIVADKIGGRLDADTARFFDSCRRNTDRLQKTIADILDFSRLRAGRMDVSAAPEPVEPVLREAVESLTPWAQKQGLGLAAAPVPPDLPPVLADRQRLLQILNNLVSNAIKSTPPGGRITLSAERGRESHDGRALFAVRDTGCGIPEQDQKRIFQEFVRVSRNARTCEGVGLGLAIVHELVKRHGGSVWVESRERQGSTFFFTIPFCR